MGRVCFVIEIVFNKKLKVFQMEKKVNRVFISSFCCCLSTKDCMNSLGFFLRWDIFFHGKNRPISPPVGLQSSRPVSCPYSASMELNGLKLFKRLLLIAYWAISLTIPLDEYNEVRPVAHLVVKYHSRFFVNVGEKIQRMIVWKIKPVEATNSGRIFW